MSKEAISTYLNEVGDRIEASKTDLSEGRISQSLESLREASNKFKALIASYNKYSK